jgi:membrane-associated phospholipid phosphatase
MHIKICSRSHKSTMKWSGLWNALWITFLLLTRTILLASQVKSFYSPSTNVVTKYYRNHPYYWKAQYSIVSLFESTTVQSVTNDPPEKFAPPLVSLKQLNPPSLVNMAVKVIGSSTTIVVAGLFFLVLLWKRDALMVSFFIGAISNGILSKILKKMINQTRPPELEHVDDIQLKPGDKGMPSSHAMSLGFISTFIACNLSWTQIPLFVYATVSLIYRVQVKLHTWQQVVVGSMVGSSNGFLWYRLCIGDNPWKLHIMNFVKRYFLNENGQLPLPLMIVPFLIGAATIGSFERRISGWIKKRQ